MSEHYEQLRAALRDRTGIVHLDVEPPRDAPIVKLVAFLFASSSGDQRPAGSWEERRPEGRAVVSVAITPEQARELLAAGAAWMGPAHMRAEVDVTKHG